MAKKTIEQMTKDELLEQATRLGLEKKVSYKSKKAEVLEVVQRELRRLERAKEAPRPELAVAPKPTVTVIHKTAPKPAPAAPAATAAKAPEVVKGTIAKVEPALKYFIDEREVPKARFLEIARAQYVMQAVLVALEAGAQETGKASTTVVVRLRGRIRKIHLVVQKG